MFEVVEVVEGTTKKKTVKIDKRVISANPEEARKKMSLSAKKRWKNENYKKTFSKIMKDKWNTPEYREKLIKAHLGQKAWNKNKKLNKGHVESISKSLIGRRLSEEHKKNIGIASAKRKHSKESIEKLRKSKTGLIHSEKTKEKISKSKKGNCCKTYVLIDPSGNKVIVNNMPEFCKINNLKYKSISSMLCGRTKEYKGYKLNK